MGLWKINNALCLSEDYDGKMDVEGLMKEGVGSIMDTRLRLPGDYLQRERKELMAAGIQYTSTPMDVNMVWPVNMMDQTCMYAMSDMSYGQKVVLHQNEGQGVVDVLAALCLVKMGMTPQQASEVVKASGRTVAMSQDQQHLLNAYAETIVYRMYNKDIDMSQFYALLQNKLEAMTQKTKSEARMYEFWGARQTQAKKGCGCGGH